MKTLEFIPKLASVEATPSSKAPSPPDRWALLGATSKPNHHGPGHTERRQENRDVTGSRRAVCGCDTRAERPDWSFSNVRLPARRLIAASSIPLAIAALSTPAHAGTISVAGFVALAQRCGSTVAPLTLAAIAKTESNFRPHIVSDNTTRRVKDFDTAAEAAVLAENLIARGHSIDLGLMQINSANLRRLGYTTRDALDPCKSVSGGARLLSRNYVSGNNRADAQIALRRALSQYNTGNIWAGYRNGYVRRVEQAARSLLAVAATPAPAMAFARLVEPLNQQAATINWTVWNGVARSDASSGNRASEEFIVF